MEPANYSPAEISLLIRGETKHHLLVGYTLTDLIWRDAISIVKMKNPRAPRAKEGVWFVFGEGLKVDELKLHERFVLENGFDGENDFASPTALMNDVWEAADSQNFHLLVEQAVLERLRGQADVFQANFQNPFDKPGAGQKTGWWKRTMVFLGLARNRNGRVEKEKTKMKASLRKEFALFQKDFERLASSNPNNARQMLNRMGGGIWLVRNLPLEALKSIGEKAKESEDLARFAPGKIEAMLKAKDIVHDFFNRKYEDARYRGTSDADKFGELISFLGKQFG